MKNPRRNRSGGIRGRSVGPLPFIVVLILVFSSLAGGVTVAVQNNAYPPLTQQLHDLIHGGASSGLQSTLLVTGSDGTQLYKGTTLTRFTGLQLPTGGELYDPSSKASGSIQDGLSAMITIQQGTPENYTISGQTQVLVDGVAQSKVPVAISQAGAPPSAGVAFPQASISGSSLWSALGGVVPASVSSHTVTFSSSGSVTVCFQGDPTCVTHTWSNPDIGSVNVDNEPNPAGAFAVSIRGSSSTSTTGGSTCSSGCGSGSGTAGSSNDFTVSVSAGTASRGGTSGTGTLSPSAGSYSYAAGSTVTLTATPSVSGSTASWAGYAAKVCSVGVACTITFTMPSQNIVETAGFSTSTTYLLSGFVFCADLSC